MMQVISALNAFVPETENVQQYNIFICGLRRNESLSCLYKYVCMYSFICAARV